MDLLVALGLSIGVLAGAWTYVASVPAFSAFLATWVGFVSWACFFAAGGKLDGLKKTVLGNMSGVVWGVVIVALVGPLGGLGSLSLPVAVCVGAFAMCVQAKMPYFGFIPGAFCGCAVYFGTGANWQLAVPGLLLGALLGYLSEVIGVAMTKKEA